MRRFRGALAALLALAIAVGAGLALRRWVAGTARVEGASMQTTLQSGDVVLVTRLDYAKAATRRGDVVQCRFPGRADTYIKRVVGLPGETLVFSGGQLTVDGTPVREKYVSSPTGDYSISLGPDEYLLLGDNRMESYDSRMADMGPVGADSLLGRVRWIVWPLRRFGPVK